MEFMGDDYLIGSEAGRRIFEAIRDLPVVDPHNHADVKEIAENRNYSDVWQLFAATDHYVWEMLRKCAVPEEYITGDRSPREKFLRMAEVFPRLVGNPVYEWVHLDLRRSLGIDTILGPATGAAVWEEANAALARPENRPLQLLCGKLNVEVMCSTDDPADDLQWHEKVNAAAGRMLVRPTWRPDKAMNITAPGWNAYIDRLGERFGMRIRTYEELLEVLRQSHDYFAAHGAVSSDHGVEVPPGICASADKAAAVFRHARDGEALSAEAAECFRGRFLLEVAGLDAEKEWVFQYHAGAVRDVRDTLFQTLGPDSGGDVCNPWQNALPGMCRLLNRFDGRLKVVLYCLDPVFQPMLASLARAFGDKVRLGSAWWLCDTPVGMRRQLEAIGAVDVFSCFAGMVSDSRKLLSYGSRFEMFRRVLADVLGSLADRGQAPLALLEETAREMAYDGPKKFFGL